MRKWTLSSSVTIVPVFWAASKVFCQMWKTRRSLHPCPKIPNSNKELDLLIYADNPFPPRHLKTSRMSVV